MIANHAMHAIRQLVLILLTAWQLSNNSALSLGANLPEDMSVRLEQAHTAYRQALDTPAGSQRLARFARAKLLLQQAADELGVRAGAGLYVNIGNAALQADQIGEAIVAYRQALQLNPRQRQARSNLNQARALVPDWVRWSDSTSVWRALFFWNDLLSLQEINGIAALCFVLAMAGLAVRIGWQRSWGAPIAGITIIAWLLCLASIVLRAYEPRIAVVMVDEVIGRTADSHAAAAQLSQPVPAGAEVIIEQQRGEWTQVSIAGQLAWLPSSSLQCDVATSPVNHSSSDGSS